MFDSADEALTWLAGDWKIWFNHLLEDWLPLDYEETGEEPEYPLPPSWENLLLLFDIHYDSLIFDSQPGPISKEQS